MSQHERLDTVVYLLDKVPGSRTDFVDAAEDVPDVFFQLVISFGSRDIQQVFVHAADVGVDGHVVVIQDNQQVGVVYSCVIQALESQSPGHGPVSDDCYRLTVFLPVQLGGNSHTQGGGNGSRRVPRAESIVFAFGSFGKTAESLVLPVRAEIFSSSGQDLVGVSLVPDIPHDVIVRSIKNVM